MKVSYIDPWVSGLRLFYAFYTGFLACTHPKKSV